MSDGATLFALCESQKPLESQLQCVVFRRVMKVVTKQLDTGELMCRETNQRKFLMGEFVDAWEDVVYPPHATVTHDLVVCRSMYVVTGCPITGGSRRREDDLH